MASPQYNDILPFVLPFVGNLPDARSAVEAGGAGATSPLGRRWFFEAEAWLAPGTAAQALEMGARAGREDVVLAALPRCSDKEVRAADKAFIALAENGLVRGLEALAGAMDDGVDGIMAKTNLLGKAMVSSAEAGHVDCVKAMLAAIKLMYGWRYVRTSLVRAAYRKQPRCLEVLLDVDVSNPKFDLSDKELLLFKAAPGEALFLAACKGNAECIRIILAARRIDVGTRELAATEWVADQPNVAECIEALGFAEPPSPRVRQEYTCT